jgi:hypothetical protein
MLNEYQKALLDFVEDTAPALPVLKRIRVYRGLADVLPVKRHRTRLLKKAAILEEAERRCAELHFTDEPHNGEKL